MEILTFEATGETVRRITETVIMMVSVKRGWINSAEAY
jgi:hypothetical protein